MWKSAAVHNKSVSFPSLSLFAFPSTRWLSTDKQRESKTPILWTWYRAFAASSIPTDRFFSSFETIDQSSPRFPSIRSLCAAAPLLAEISLTARFPSVSIRKRIRFNPDNRLVRKSRPSGKSPITAQPTRDPICAREFESRRARNRTLFTMGWERAEQRDTRYRGCSRFQVDWLGSLAAARLDVRRETGDERLHPTSMDATWRGSCRLASLYRLSRLSPRKFCSFVFLSSSFFLIQDNAKIWIIFKSDTAEAAILWGKANEIWVGALLGRVDSCRRIRWNFVEESWNAANDIFSIPILSYACSYSMIEQKK